MVILNNITKLYGAQKAVDNVSFEALPGQILGFLGPNGAGKSTTMKIITGFLPQTTGTATVCGINIAENAMAIKQEIGYLPEHNPLYLDMYVKEYLHFVAGVYGLKKDTNARVKEMIDITGLGVEQNKKIGQLSKGYRQRVGLAQAIIHNPKVLILDEPTSGLDPNQLADIRTLIKNLGKEKTVILSTHIMQEVQAMCQNVVIINKGKIVANNALTELQKNTQQISYLIELDKPVDVSFLENLPFISKVQNEANNKYTLYSNTTDDVRAQIFNAVANSGSAMLSIDRKENSLEEIFRSLTQNN